MDSGSDSDRGTRSQSASNLPPVWQPVATIQFTQGVASSISIAAYVSDPNGDALTITKNAVALPAGSSLMRLATLRLRWGRRPRSTSGHVLTADDGKL